MNKNVINTDLTGKVAVVTGAGGVLCSAFSKVLANAGAKVALLDINEAAAQAIAEEINAAGDVAKAYKCNVLDKADCCAVAEDPCMEDIGILASTDPVAIDMACLDLAKASNDQGKHHLLERINSLNGAHTIDVAAEHGYGSKKYELIKI